MQECPELKAGVEKLGAGRIRPRNSYYYSDRALKCPEDANS